MKTMLLAALLISGAALAQTKAPAAAPAPVKEEKKEMAPAAKEIAQAPLDMSKMGPWTRKPTNEKATKKEIEDFFKKEDELAAKGDMAALLDRVDFPVYMTTDDAKGVIEAKSYSKEEYVAMMKPMYENMPKDSKTVHKPTVMVLSDALVAVTDDYTTTMGKQKMTGRNSGLLVKSGGAWKWKTMVEAGWGGMAPPAPAAAPEKPAAPAPAPAKK